MTLDQLKQNFETFHRVNEPTEKIKELFEQAINSGALNFDNEEEDSYLTAKSIYAAIFQELAFYFAPVSTEGKRIVKNLNNFLNA